jgi:UDP-N-acetylmuramyl pentapeptide phosphotransferase/UDP-N-acetylglucosamine-1-phosphate transferase
MVIGANLRLNTQGVMEIFSGSMVQVFFLLCALMLMYLCGIADDLIGVRYRAKFALQIISGILIVMSGMWIKSLDGFIGIHDLYFWVGWALTVLLIIYVINAINLIDGIDGLASGLSAIALAFYGYIFFRTGQYIYFILSGAALGTLIPFFYFNVFGNAETHKKIFMGDTGALTIGTMLAFFALAVCNTETTDINAYSNRLVLAIAPIMLPCFDVLRVFFHRIRHGKNPFLPDKSHIHHKLLALGCKQWQALILIVLLDGVFISSNLLMAHSQEVTWIILGDILFWTIFNMALTKMIRIREDKLGKDLYN